MSFNRLKILLYSFSFFDEFILIYPLYAVMFADEGLNPAQISSLFIAWSVTAFMLEIPSGSVADKYSRKYVLMAAAFLKVLAFACWLLFPNYAGFLAGFLLWGVNSALASGTTEAFVYDELKRFGKTTAYAKVAGRMESLELIGMAAAALVASLSAQNGYDLVLSLSIIAAGISTGIIALFPNVKKVASAEEDNYLSYLVGGLRLVWRSPRILFIIGFAALFTGLSSADEYWSLLFREQGLSNQMIAFWTGVILIVAAIGSNIAYKFEERTALLPGLLFLLGASLFAVPLLPGSVSPLALCVFVVIFYVVKVLFGTYLQHEIDDRTRATTTSVSGFIAELFALVVFGIFAVTATTDSYSLGFQVTAGFIFIGWALYVFLHKRVAQKL